MTRIDAVQVADIAADRRQTLLPPDCAAVNRLFGPSQGQIDGYGRCPRLFHIGGEVGKEGVRFTFSRRWVTETEEARGEG